MWLKLCVFVLCTICSTATVQISPDKSVFSVLAGSDLHVNCSSTNGVTWSSNPSRAMGKNAQTHVEGSVAGSDNISTLTLNNVDTSNRGTFKCIDTSTQDEVAFLLRVFTMTTTQDANYEYKEDILLECKVEDNNHTFTYSWLKGGVPVSDIKVDSKQEFIQHRNGSLEIRHPRRNFAGIYTCVAEYEEDGVKDSISVDVKYYAQPKVIPFDKSKNLVQDERLVIECKVIGYPEPVIEWFKEGEPIKTGGEEHYKLSPANSYDGEEIKNGKLVIDSVDFDDAAEYECMATQERWPGFNSTQVILVRVKDKLAALWPFLGIVAEVVVLCTIIFIYEKKRSKDAVVEEDANQDGASAEKKAEGVRHRGSPNNPRA